jgi:hypothetical protein
MSAALDQAASALQIQIEQVVYAAKGLLCAVRVWWYQVSFSSSSKSPHVNIQSMSQQFFLLEWFTLPVLLALISK